MKTVRIPALLLTVIFLFGLGGCGGYRSSYDAVGCVDSGNSQSVSLRFHQLSGTKVYRLKMKNAEGGIVCSGKLGEGHITVSYDYRGIKSELFTLSGGESLAEQTLGYIEQGPVWLLVETDGLCKDGEFRFSLSQ